MLKYPLPPLIWSPAVEFNYSYSQFWVPRFTGKTRITGKTAEIPERPKRIIGIKICYPLSLNAKLCINLFGAKSMLYVYCKYNYIILNI